MSRTQKILRIAFFALGIATSITATRNAQAQQDGRTPESKPLSKPQVIATTPLQDERVSESSGLALSRNHPGWFWTHNDSGDPARFFLVDDSGKTRGTWYLHKADAIDWEDMAAFSREKTPYLIFGDIGGNARPRQEVSLYVVPEPKWTDDASQAANYQIDQFQTIHVEIGEKITDFESLAIDSESQIGLLIEKSIQGGRVFQFPLELSETTQRVQAREIGRTTIPMATACDIARDQSSMVVLSYFGFYVFQRHKNADGNWESWIETLRRPPQGFSLPKFSQAEAICFGEESHVLYMTSERLPTPLWKLHWEIK